MKEPKTYNSQTPVLNDKGDIFLAPRIREKKREELRRQREQGRAGFKK